MWQRKVMNGWDDIDLTAQHGAEIERFAMDRVAALRWAQPAS